MAVGGKAGDLGERLNRIEPRMKHRWSTDATASVRHIPYSLPKAGLHSRLGSVSWERQQQIKSKLKEVFRL